MQLEMIPCPKCGNDFPLKRKELGYHVCINCSTVKPKVAITTVEGEGDHTWNDIIIMDQDQAIAIARKAAELSGMRADLEFIDFDTEGEENEVSQSVKDTVLRINEDEEDDAPISSVEDEPQGVQGIDY
jgi:hypothetical protein